MAKKNRSRRLMSPRTILRLEALEDRTLLSGNVLAYWDANIPGQLDIKGDNGNNSIAIYQTAPGVLHVAGIVNLGPPPDATTVNGVPSQDFALSSITSINVALQGGKDTVNVGGAGSAAFKIPGNLTIMAGGGTDTFTTTGIKSNTVYIRATGPGKDTITMSDTSAGMVRLSTGGGADSISMDNHSKAGMNIGSVSISTGAGMANDSVSINGFTGVGSVPGIGSLSLMTADGNNAISVTNSTFSLANLISGNGGGSVTFDKNSARTGMINVGTGATTVDASGNTIIGPAGLSVNVGTAGSAAADNVSVNNNNVAAGPLSVNVATAGSTAADNVFVNNNNVGGALAVKVNAAGSTALDNVFVNSDTVGGALTVNALANGPQYWVPPDKDHPNGQVLPSSNLSVNNDKAGGAVTVNTGNFFQTVTVGTTGSSLSSTIGTNSQTVTFATQVGAESIAVGDFASPQPPIPLLPLSSFSLSGSATTLGLTVGANAAGGVSQTATVGGDESVSVGANAGAVTVWRPSKGNSTVKVLDNSGAVTVKGNDDAGDAALTETITVGNNLAGPLTVQDSLKVSGKGSWNQYINIGDKDTVNVSTNVVGNQTIQSATGATGTNDNVTVNSVTVSGALTISLLGSGDTVTVDPTTVGSLALSTGDKAAISVITTTATAGGVSVTAGNGAAISLATVSATGGGVSVGAGNGAAISLGTVSATGDVKVSALDTASISLGTVTSTGGNVSVGAGNGAAISLEKVSSSGGSVIASAGDHAVKVALDNVTANHGNVNVTVGDNAAEIDVTNTTASTMNIYNNNNTTTPTDPPYTLIYLSNDNVGTGSADFGGGLNVYSLLGGNNTLEMIGVNVLGGLLAMFGNSSAGNSVFAQNVVCDFGLVDGGAGPSNLYYDLGGNSGYWVNNFIGYGF
jgi:hypothetical protein